MPEGIVYGFLGPNRAGKITTTRLLMERIRPTARSGSVAGAPVTVVVTLLLAVGNPLDVLEIVLLAFVGVVLGICSMIRYESVRLIFYWILCRKLGLWFNEV